MTVIWDLCWNGVNTLQTAFQVWLKSKASNWFRSSEEHQRCRSSPSQTASSAGSPYGSWLSVESWARSTKSAQIQSSTCLKRAQHTHKHELQSIQGNKAGAWWGVLQRQTHLWRWGFQGSTPCCSCSQRGAAQTDLRVHSPNNSFTDGLQLCIHCETLTCPITVFDMVKGVKRNSLESP